MLSFFSDIILLILPLLNSFWFLVTVLVLVFNLSNFKKNMLRGVMIISSITAPFVLLFQFTPPDEGVSFYSQYLHTGMLSYSMSLFVFSFLAGIIALFRLHVFGGKSNAPSKASGRIHEFSLRDFFRKQWRILFYICAIVVWIITVITISFYFENWDDFHPEAVEVYL
jgi:hypothetical protein